MKTLQFLAGGTRMVRHRHTQPYAAVVLEGSYQEAGDNGRCHMGPGDVLLHDAFLGHADCVSKQGTTLLNLPLPILATGNINYAKARDPDRLAVTAERDPQAAAVLLLDELQPKDFNSGEPVDALAAALAAPDVPSLADWARQQGVRRETVFRWFYAAYGVSPTQFRTESRARAAWREIVGSTEPLACIAANLGYADQAHMSRAVRKLTGSTPHNWRQDSPLQHSFKKKAA